MVSQITDFNRVEFIYKSLLTKDFPRNERRPLVSIQKMWERKLYDCYQMEEKGGLLGYAFFLKLEENGQFHYLLDYYAIVSEYRSCGYGSLFLKQLSGTIHDALSMIVEVEDPDEAEEEEARTARWKRLQFYLRNGYQETGVTASVFGVTYRILNIADKTIIPAEKVREIYDGFYRQIVPELMYHKFIKIISL